MPTRTEADQTYEDLYQAIVGALPADSEQLAHHLDGVVRECLVAAEAAGAAVVARAVRRALS